MAPERCRRSHSYLLVPCWREGGCHPQWRTTLDSFKWGLTKVGCQREKSLQSARFVASFHCWLQCTNPQQTCSYWYSWPPSIEHRTYLPSSQISPLLGSWRGATACRCLAGRKCRGLLIECPRRFWERVESRWNRRWRSSREAGIS